MRLTQSIFMLIYIVSAWSSSIYHADAQETVPQQVAKTDLVAIMSLLAKDHPELSGSPGTKASMFFPSIGEAGCSMDPQPHAGSAAWVGVTVGSIEDFIASVTPTVNCRAARADVYLQPFERSGNRSKGAFVRCSAPPQRRINTQALSDWRCDEPIFREYVQLDNQACEVTVIGDVSDAALKVIKQLGLKITSKVPPERRDTLLKFQRVEGNQAFAVFGTDACNGGGRGGTTVLFQKMVPAEGDDGNGWTVTDRLIRSSR